jgi:sporulation integral membrane protein YlbJ
MDVALVGRRGYAALAYMAAAVALLILIYPKQSFDAALNGVAIWWDVLFPALFPFFVVSELMLGFGIVHFFGTLLDPMMRPVFRIPGSGGFVMAMGFAAGYPVGARLTSQLWDAKLINREESERLAAYTTTSDPIFLIGAVAVGFFHNAALAPVLAVAHYGGAVIVGLLMRFWGGRTTPKVMPIPEIGKRRVSIWRRAFESMHKARISDGRPFGTLLIQGVQSGLRLIIVVGGLVVFFSVVIEVLTIAGVIGLIQSFIASVLSAFNIPGPLSAAIVNGFFEVTLGAKTAAASFPGADLRSQAVVAAFVLSWAGLSVHAQSMSLMHHMPVRYSSFFLARFVHALLSSAIAYFAWNKLAPVSSAFFPADALAPESGWEAFSAYTPFSLGILAFTLAALLLLCFLWSIGRSLLRVFSR